MKLFKKKHEKPQLSRPTFREDFEKFIETPLSYEAYSAAYLGDVIPTDKTTHYLMLLIHLHRKELEELKKKLEVAEK